MAHRRRGDRAGRRTRPPRVSRSGLHYEQRQKEPLRRDKECRPAGHRHIRARDGSGHCRRGGEDGRGDDHGGGNGLAPGEETALGHGVLLSMGCRVGDLSEACWQRAERPLNKLARRGHGAQTERRPGREEDPTASGVRGGTAMVSRRCPWRPTRRCKAKR